MRNQCAQFHQKPIFNNKYRTQRNMPGASDKFSSATSARRFSGEPDANIPGDQTDHAGPGPACKTGERNHKTMPDIRQLSLAVDGKPSKPDDLLTPTRQPFPIHNFYSRCIIAATAALVEVFFCLTYSNYAETC